MYNSGDLARARSEKDRKKIITNAFCTSLIVRARSISCRSSWLERVRACPGSLGVKDSKNSERKRHEKNIHYILYNFAPSISLDLCRFRSSSLELAVLIARSRPISLELLSISVELAWARLSSLDVARLFFNWWSTIDIPAVRVIDLLHVVLAM